MNRARRVIFLRHGRTEWNLQQRFQGQTDISLDEVGVAQAERAAAMLVALAPDRIISSDLVRARATAEPVARLVGVPVESDRNLRETFAGTWEGLTRAELLARYGDAVAAWGASSDQRPGEHGETRIEVAARVVQAVERGLAGLDAGATLLVVTHGGAARAGIGHLLGLPPEHWAMLGVMSNCSWSILVEDVSPFGPRWRLQEYNAGTLPEPALADDR